MLAAVFAAAVVRQVTGRGPPLWVAFALGAVVTIPLGVLSVPDVATELASSAPTLAFLFALFVFASALESAGALDHLARWLVGRARRPGDLPFFLFVGFGLASALMINDALVLIGAPILIGVALRLGVAPKPLLFVLAFAVTVGSTLTPFGNPQNLLVAGASGLASPVATFLRYLALPTALNLLLGGWYLRGAYRDRMPPDDDRYARARAEAPPLWPTGGWGRRLVERPVLGVFPVTLGAIVGLSVTAAFVPAWSLPSWEIALGGAVVLLALSPLRSTDLRRVNWSVLLLFAGLFVVVDGAVRGGVIAGLESFLPIPGPGHTPIAVGAIVGSSLVGSQLVSNVPWVALQIPLLTSVGYGAGTPIAWMALAAGSTLAGSVTLLGAISNVILVDAAERRGITIRLGEFVRNGLPIAAITVAVLVVCLSLGL